MYLLRQIAISSILMVGMVIFVTPSLSAKENMIARGGGAEHSNEMYSGNRFDAGSMGDSNRMYSGNAADNTQGQSNRMYSGNAADNTQGQSNRMYSGNAYDNNFRGVNPYYNAVPVEPVAPVYGYGYYGSAPIEPNSEAFPDSTEANALYWNEVQNMEKK
jgi:hypothetical protein